MHNRTHIHVPRSIGAKAADTITAFAGAWLFIALHVIWFTLWFVLKKDINTLTLIVSLEAIFLASFVLMSQNRSGERDKLRDDLEAREVDDLTQMNRQQLEILTQQSEILTLLKGHAPDPREELMRKNDEMLRQIDQLLKRIRAVDKLKPGG